MISQLFIRGFVSQIQSKTQKLVRAEAVYFRICSLFCL